MSQPAQDDGAATRDRYEMTPDLIASIPGLDLTSIQTYLRFLSVARELAAALQAQMERYDLSEGKFTVLMSLRKAPGHRLTPSELAERAQVTRATMTGLLAGIERAGLVSRGAHPEDGRAAVIHLTRRGLDLLDRMLPEHFSRIDRLMADFSEADKKAFMKLLSKLERGLSVLRDP